MTSHTQQPVVAPGELQVITGRNIWETKCTCLCITINSMVKRNGRAVMGRGIALEAVRRFPNIDLVLAEKLDVGLRGFIPLMKTDRCKIFGFQTKVDWRYPSTIQLIERSAQMMVEYWQENPSETIALPAPGCGNGGLKWFDVLDALRPIVKPMGACLSIYRY